MIGAGRTSGMKPAGLGARDTLRLEAGMMLNGQDMTQDMSPLEVPYGWLVDWDKDFAGKTGLVSLRDRGIAKKIAGLEMTGRGIARHGYAVKSGDKEIGMVTSGTFAPTLNKAVALAFIDTAFTAPDTEVSVVIRNTESAARVVKLPFYKRPK